MADLFNIPKNILPDWIDKYGSQAFFISLIVIFQGCFGGMGIIQTPKVISDIVNHPLGRFLYILAISYTATSDIETALVTTVVFLFAMHLLRTPEERKELKSLI